MFILNNSGSFHKHLKKYFYASFLRLDINLQIFLRFCTLFCKFFQFPFPNHFKQSTTAFLLILIMFTFSIFNPTFFEFVPYVLLILPSAGSRSGSPGRVLTTTTLSTMNTGVQRVLVNPATAQKRSKIPRSQGCSREASPSRLSVGKNFFADHVT